MRKFYFGLLVNFLAMNVALAQRQPVSPLTFPQIKGYFAILHPIVNFDKNGSHYNFSKGYTVGFPIGINILKSAKKGFSFEFVPAIHSENGSDKVSSVLIHPGLMFRYANGFTFIQRLAFETNGRYGFTPVFNKVFLQRQNISYYVAVPIPVRFGNDKPPSVGGGIQFGISF
jgi:hypothetical protein